MVRMCTFWCFPPSRPRFRLRPFACAACFGRVASSTGNRTRSSHPGPPPLTKVYAEAPPLRAFGGDGRSRCKYASYILLCTRKANFLLTLARGTHSTQTHAHANTKVHTARLIRPPPSHKTASIVESTLFLLLNERVPTTSNQNHTKLQSLSPRPPLQLDSCPDQNRQLADKF